MMRFAHIGIVACSSEGAALCFRSICSQSAEFPGNTHRHHHPEVSMHCPSLQRYVDFLEQGDLHGVAGLTLESSRKLAAMGARFLICPDNTIHSAFHLVERDSPLPWLHIAAVVADSAASRGFRRVGVMGTKWLVESEVYPQKLSAKGIECVRPSPEDKEEVSRIIMQELNPLNLLPGSVGKLRAVVERFREQNCSAVILGCTELPLVLCDYNCCIPTLDSTKLLAAAAVHHSHSMMT